MDQARVPEPVPLTVCDACSSALAIPVRIAKSDAVSHAERHARAFSFAEALSDTDAGPFTITGPPRG